MLLRGRLHGPLQRALHDDGDRLDDGLPGRGARHAAAGLGGLARGRLPADGDRAGRGAAHRGDGGGGAAPLSDPDREAFENAVRVNAAIGGSTNAVIHLLAIAGRVGVDLSLRDFDELARAVPTLVNLMPSGKYLMEDFCYAGGLPAVLAELLGGGLLHGSQITVTGRTIAENNTGSTDNTGNTGNTERVGSDPDPDPDFDVITRLDAPFQPAGTGIAVLRGNLCPDGAVIKQSAASPHLLTHRGPARVFDSPEAYHEVADDPDLDIDENTVIVIRNAGPKGYPGMPEVANVPLPAKLLKAGVKDMVRVCDGRMSGTGYGTVVLHVAPEAAVGGPSPWSTTGTRSSSTSPPHPAPGRRRRRAHATQAGVAGTRRTARRRLRLALHPERRTGRPGRRLRIPAGKPRTRGSPRLPLRATSAQPLTTLTARSGERHRSWSAV